MFSNWKKTTVQWSTFSRYEESSGVSLLSSSWVVGLLPEALPSVLKPGVVTKSMEISKVPGLSASFGVGSCIYKRKKRFFLLSLGTGVEGITFFFPLVSTNTLSSAHSPKLFLQTNWIYKGCLPSSVWAAHFSWIPHLPFVRYSKIEWCLVNICCKFSCSLDIKETLLKHQMISLYILKEIINPDYNSTS